MTRKLPYLSPMAEPTKSGYYRTEASDQKRGTYLPTIEEIYTVAAMLQADISMGELAGHTKYDPSRYKEDIPGIRVLAHPTSSYKKQILDTEASLICDSEYWNQTPESLD